MEPTATAAVAERGQGALFKTLFSGATPCIAGHLRKSRDTLQKVIKEQRLSWKN